MKIKIIRTLEKDKKNILWILKVFVFWRLSLFIFSWLGIKFLPFKESFPYIKEVLIPYGSNFFWSWANFDGVHYLGIAQKGYFAQYTQAFFPFYPLLIRYLNYLFHNYLFTGLLISHLSFLLTLYFLYKLISLDYDKRVARSTLLFLIFFPASFFFASFYTESLFLLLLISSFYTVRCKKFLLAGILGFLAAFSRVIGVLLVPVLLYEIYEDFRVKNKKSKLEIIKKVLFSLLPVAALGLYMNYLAVNFSDPLYFIHAQPAFGASRSVNKVILLYQVFFRYIKMIFTFNINKLFYFAVILEFLSALLFLILLIIAYKQKIRPTYLLFSSLAYIIPTLTGTFSSMPRYVLVLFPCFLVLGSIKNYWLKNIIYIFFFILLAFSTMLFTRGYWVA